MGKFFVDGGGYNGKVSKICVANEQGYEFVKEFEEDLTNNECEYRALLHALEICKEGDEIITDSKLVEGQVNKGWRCNYEHLLELKKKAHGLMYVKKAKLFWIRRGGNLAGRILDRLKGEEKRERRKGIG